MKLKIFFIVLLFFCNFVFADSAYIDRQTGFSFPVSIAGFAYGDKREYDDPRLGYGLNYYSKDEILITVIVYNLGITDIQDGVNGPHVLSQYTQARNDVARAVGAGHYRSAIEISDLIKFPSYFLRGSYNIVRNDGLEQRSHLFIRGQDGYFIKVRATGENSNNFDTRIINFLEQLLIVISSKKVV